MDWLGAGPKQEEAVEQIHGLLDVLVEEQDRVMRDLRQENKRLRQQIAGLRAPSGGGKCAPAPAGPDAVASFMRSNGRCNTLPIPGQIVTRVRSEGSCSAKSSPPPTSASGGSVNVLGLRNIGIVTLPGPPGTVDDDLSLKSSVFGGEGKLQASGTGGLTNHTLSWTAPCLSSLPPPPLKPPSSYSWVSGGSSSVSCVKRRVGPPMTTPQATLKSQPGLLSAGTQDVIRKLARVVDEDIGHHRGAQRFEQELQTQHMGILGLIFRHRLSVDAEDIESVSPLRAKVLMLLSWWVFDAVIGLLIVANAVSIGVETSFAANDRSIPAGMQVLEALFLAVFLSELCMRFYAVGVRVLLSHWVKFDTVLVLCGLFDVLVKVTGSNSVLDQFLLVRMFRLMRLARAARLVVQFRTLWLLVQGLLLSCLPMLYTFGILCSLVYVFAVFGLTLMPITDEYGPEYEAIVAKHFCSIGDAMLLLVQFIFLDSVGPILRVLVTARPELCVYFFTFILLGSVSLMNLVTAIMVESSIRQASEDQEARKAWEVMRRRQMAPKLRAMFKALDSDGSGSVSLEDIALSPSELQQQLLYLCNMDDLRETFEMLDYDNSGLVDAEEFVNGVMRVQADKPAELIRLVKQCSDILKKMVTLERRLEELDGQLPEAEV